MNKKERIINDLVKTIDLSEHRLLRFLETLDGAGNECHCKACEAYQYIHYGELLEIMQVCLNCGGYIEI